MSEECGYVLEYIPYTSLYSPMWCLLIYAAQEKTPAALLLQGKTPVTGKNSGTPHCWSLSIQQGKTLTAGKDCGGGRKQEKTSLCQTLSLTCVVKHHSLGMVYFSLQFGATHTLLAAASDVHVAMGKCKQDQALKFVTLSLF